MNNSKSPPKKHKRKRNTKHEKRKKNKENETRNKKNEKEKQHLRKPYLRDVKLEKFGVEGLEVKLGVLLELVNEGHVSREGDVVFHVRLMTSAQNTAKRGQKKKGRLAREPEFSCFTVRTVKG